MVQYSLCPPGLGVGVGQVAGGGWRGMGLSGSVGFLTNKKKKKKKEILTVLHLDIFIS